MEADLEIIRNNISKVRILVVGDTMLDKYWHGEVDRVSPEAPVPIVRVVSEEHRLGGAANVAFNARKLGANTTLLSIAGYDEAAIKLQKLLSESGIDAIINQDTNVPTIVKLRIISRAQQLLRADFENQPTLDVLNSQLATFNQIVSEHDIIVLSDYGKGGLKYVSKMIETARSLGIPVLVDPKGADYTKYANATIITPNRSELAQVTGIWNGEAHLQSLAENLRDTLGLTALLLTRSEDGMTLFAKDGITHIPTDAREVFDITGAGDTVIATTAVMLAAGLPLQRAVKIANRAAGLVVGKFGTASVSYTELFN